MHAGPIVIGYDGSPASEEAVREAAELLGERPALVVVVTKTGIGFELMELPTMTIGLPPATLDVRTALALEEAQREQAERLAQKGAALARDAGLPADALVVAEEVEVPIADTLVRVARERDAQAVVVGPHGHGRIGEVLLGSTTRDVIRRATCPVVVGRQLNGAAPDSN
ncbi:MAG TPA: universal stress protein [Solirubrobacteraceae bacterium]|jgi:nucleotide-binding universal stress UspA family protein|nr:universal stress protein [Solirubrobacteraceae bacterium]